MENYTPTKDGKMAAIIAHFFILGPVIAFFINEEQKDPFGSFYIKQNLGLTGVFLLLGALVGAVPNAYAAYGFYAFIFILWVFSFTGAVSNEYKSIPFLGDLIQKIFSRKK